MVSPTSPQRAAALLLGDIGGQYTIAEHGVVEVKVALLLVVGLLHLLTAVLVLGGREALIADANVGALQVLAGPVGKAQAWVLAAFIYVFPSEGSRKNVSEGN